ncbi:hypothetical protein DFQ28_000029 [Apophysomyces sp. BC1034]|nr:hypothetical protein DFQ30_005461 [Apophysomyces sp. BC1015]KAG0182789.1 hypothetical protein DFQ29_002201 [Apophysomyces sp. BC1021]KAG0194930.1 hypothetical protein DFQ28_000029 [Apophysomyces sp. BC1034]
MLLCLASSSFKKPTWVRHASVLTALPPNPTQSRVIECNTPHIVTPASAPLTTPSNNAFNPDYIPNKTKARLTLTELRDVLDTSKILLQRLQQDYVAQTEDNRQLQELAKEQLELIKTLQRQHRSPEDDEN